MKKKDEVKLTSCEFLEEMQELDEQSNLDDKIKKLRKRVDFSNPDEVVTVSGRTYINLLIEESY